MQALADWRRAEGWWQRTRAAQARAAFEEEVRLGLLARLTADPALAARIEAAGAEVAAGRADPGAAAAKVLAALRPGL
jgi:LAO/AO transport system kinase